MPPSEGQEPRALTVAAQAIEGRKCAETAKVHPDLRIVYNLAYGVLAGEAGRFSLVGNYTTTIQRPTVLSWAFSFLDPAEHAGFARILRVPGGGQTQCRWLPVRPFSALCSLGISANFFAVAHVHRLARQRLVHVSAFLVRRPVWSSRPSGRGEVPGRARHSVHALAPVGLHECPVGMQRPLVLWLPLVRGFQLEQVDRLVADRGSRCQCVEVLVRDAPGLSQQGGPCKGPPRG